MSARRGAWARAIWASGSGSSRSAAAWRAGSDSGPTARGRGSRPGQARRALTAAARRSTSSAWASNWRPRRTSAPWRSSCSARRARGATAARARRDRGLRWPAGSGPHAAPSASTRRAAILVLHSAEGYEERGLGVTLSVGSPSDQEGLSLSVSPRWGGPAAASGAPVGGALGRARPARPRSGRAVVARRARSLRPAPAGRTAPRLVRRVQPLRGRLGPDDRGRAGTGRPRVPD